MTAWQLLIMAGVILLAHELTPSARAILGLAVGIWGALFAVAALVF